MPITVAATPKSSSADQALGGRLLYDELSHRMTNEFASAASMLRIGQRGTQEAAAREAVNEAIERLQAFAALQRALMRPCCAGDMDLGSELVELIGLMAATRASKLPVRINVSAETLFLDVEQAWCLKLAISELVTNAYKHAFRSCGGDLRVELQSIGVEAQLTIASASADSAAIRLPVRTEAGRGSSIICGLVAAIGGRIELHRRPAAFAARVTFPVGWAHKSHPD